LGSLGNFAKALSGNDIIVPHLNTWFANAEFPDVIPVAIHPNKEEDDAFHPSSALKCAQELYAYFREDLPEERHSADSQKNFMVGHMYHSLFQWIIVDQLKFATWDDIEQEHDYTFETANGNPFRVRGFVDVARCVIPGREPYLLDIKTVNSRIFSGDSLPPTTLAKYQAQVKIYLEFVDLEHAIILCLEKDSPHRFKEIMVKRDPAFVNSIMDKWEVVADGLVTGEAPSCTCSDPEKCSTQGLYDDDDYS
jgi:hypothetical protein